MPCLVCLWRSGTVQSHVSANVVPCGFWCGFGEVAARWNGFWLVITLLFQSLVEQHGKKFADLQVSSLLTNTSFHSTFIHSHLALSSCFCSTCTAFSADHMNPGLNLIVKVVVVVCEGQCQSVLVCESPCQRSLCIKIRYVRMLLSVMVNSVGVLWLCLVATECMLYFATRSGWSSPVALPGGNTVYALLCTKKWVVESVCWEPAD